MKKLITLVGLIMLAGTQGVCAAQVTEAQRDAIKADLTKVMKRVIEAGATFATEAEQSEFTDKIIEEAVSDATIQIIQEKTGKKLTKQELQDLTDEE